MSPGQANKFNSDENPAALKTSWTKSVKACVPCSLSFLSCLLLLTNLFFFFAFHFLIIPTTMISVLFLLIMCIFITWVSVCTLIFIHILPHHDTFFVHDFSFCYLFLFCSSSDHEITFFVAVCEKINSTKKKKKKRTADRLVPWETLKTCWNWRH